MKKRADGRYCKQVVVGYRDDGKRIVKNIYGKTIKEIERKERELQGTIESGIDLSQDDITVAEWGSKWLNVYKAKVSRGTYAMYENCLRNHIIPSIGAISLQKLKPIQVQEALNYIISRGNIRTAEIYKLTIKQIVNQAVEEGIVAKSVCNKLESIRSNTEEKRVLTDFEILCISKSHYTEKEKLFLDILYYTGVRRGEALALTVWDIDKNRRTISINKSLDLTDNVPTVKEPKSEAGRRDIPIPDNLYSELIDYISRHKNTYLFTMNNGKMISRSSFRKMWDSIIRKTKETAKELTAQAATDSFLPKADISFTPHTFRHTYATNLYYANIDIKRSQYLLGHSTIEMTLRIYTHLDNRNNSDVADRLNDFFSQSKNQSKISQTGFYRGFTEKEKTL